MALIEIAVAVPLTDPLLFGDPLEIGAIRLRQSTRPRDETRQFRSGGWSQGAAGRTLALGARP